MMKEAKEINNNETGDESSDEDSSSGDSSPRRKDSVDSFDEDLYKNVIVRKLLTPI